MSYNMPTRGSRKYSQRTVGLTRLIMMSSLLLLIFFSPQTASACGNIISWDGENEVREPIIRCSDPFNVTTNPPSPYTLEINGTVVNSGDSIVGSELKTSDIKVEGESYLPMQIYSLYRHEGDDYRYVLLDAPTPTLDDYREFALGYFTLSAEVDLYINILKEDRETGNIYQYFYDENFVELKDEWTGEPVYSRYNNFVEEAEAYLYSLVPTIKPGTYTMVIEEQELIFSRRSLLERFIDFIVPTAFAQTFLGSYIYTVTFTLTEPAPTGASSVLFLPGIQASRLYKDGLLGTEDQLWEPNRNQDALQLEMTEEGFSVNDIYTRDVIDEALGAVDIYDNYINFMNELVATGTIKAWHPFAYDWRYSVEDVVISGTRYENEIVSLINVVEDLQAESFTGKVTIVAHSNGGLLAKLLISELDRLGQVDMIDQLILLGVPQLGTPTAIAALLHGYDQAKLGGLLIDAASARFATQNMPGAYGLLPGQAYFSTQSGLVVSFDTSLTTELFRDEYGNAINNAAEMREFMIGSEGRATANEENEALLANATLVDEALLLRQEKLDNWVAPSNIQVTEIVGVGLDTESGFEYREFSERVCVEVGSFGEKECEEIKFYRPVPLMSQYGDETVMAVSAEAYVGNKNTFYFDLKASRDAQLKYSHGDITESNSIQLLLNNIIINLDNNAEIDFILEERPVYTNDRAIIGVHSPVSLSVKSADGLRVGVFSNTNGELEIIEEIPGSSYRELAGAKYIIVPTGINYDILLEGEDEGGMTLTIDALEGEDQTPLITVPFSEISSTTVIKLSNKGGLDITDFTNLQVDKNGDGVVDYQLTTEGEVVVDPPSTTFTYDDLKQAIISLNLNHYVEKSLLVEMRLAERFSKKKEPVFARLEKKFLHKLEWSLKLLLKRNKISETDHEKVTGIINSLLKN